MYTSVLAISGEEDNVYAVVEPLPVNVFTSRSIAPPPISPHSVV